VVRAGWELNAPLRVTQGQAQDTFLSADNANVVIDTVKKAEDSDDLVVRLYEANGAWCRTKVTLPEGTASVALVDILEERPEPLTIVDGAVTLELGPFAVRSLKLRR